MTKNTKAEEKLVDEFEALVFTAQHGARHPEISRGDVMKKNGNRAYSLREAVQHAGELKGDRNIIGPLVHNAKKVLGYRDDQLKKARDARAKKVAKK